MPDLPDLDLPPELHWTQVAAEPMPKVVFSVDEVDAQLDAENVSPYVVARVVFEYNGITVPVNSTEAAVVDEDGRRMFRRDLSKERVHLSRLKTLSLDLESGGVGGIRLPRKRLAEVIKLLVDVDWAVETDGAEVRSAKGMSAKIKSGIDWFDLEAVIDFGQGVTVSLPELLNAASAGQQMLQLSDDSFGMVPDWIKRYASLSKLGKSQGSRLRFAPSQAGVLDALMAGHEGIEADVKFERLREQLAQSDDPSGIVEPKGFRGKLRDYQKGGYAWMKFIETHGYGGCLADDMGLGKTVQVLCMLQGRHRPESGEKVSPSLVVVPKSLVHNWVSESGKFTELKAVDYTGTRKAEYRDRLEEFDLIITTYGTLRTEILRFLEIRFESLILDEAQAIKNPRSQAAKACRLIQAKHRLAISGTPIENGLNELWSLFEFLNPGMLGRLSDFAAPGREKNEEWLASLSRALKPFMLRRTKTQVLTELPEKTEQLLIVNLEEEERRRYEELRNYYRLSLQGSEAQADQKQSKLHVLEALLRLRQAACHPGLVDPTRMDEPSAKMEALFERLNRLVPAGHKVLIFSQFTTLLEIVKRRLTRENIGHAYLDGGTADRKKTVDSFTEDPNCAVFLISLKAGGCGLNLTQSDYVFILDPWWNPAIEAQAVDRAYRMGQKNPVFAYRIVAANTVEEKIVKLQSEKRKLADTIVTADTGPLSSLSPEDIDSLLSA